MENPFDSYIGLSLGQPSQSIDAVSQYANQVQPQQQVAPQPAMQEQPEEDEYTKYENRRRTWLDWRAKAIANVSKATAGLPPEQANSRRSAVKDYINEIAPLEGLKPFEETGVYQNAREEVKNLNEKNRVTLQLGSQLKQMGELIDKGDVNEAANIAKLGVMKSINSIVSPDALSIGEIIFKAPNLANALELNALQNANAYALKGWAIKAFNYLTPEKFKELKDKMNSGKMSATDAGLDFLENAAKSDPIGFHRTATGVYNSAAEPYNEAVADIEQRTSKAHARALGARRLMTFKPAEEQQQPEAQTAPARPTQMSPTPEQIQARSTPAPQAAPFQPAPTPPKKYGKPKFQVANP